MLHHTLSTSFHHIQRHFKNSVMRDATKSKLSECLTKNIKQCDLPNNAAHVVDGGALTYSQLATESYV